MSSGHFRSLILTSCLCAGLAGCESKTDNGTNDSKPASSNPATPQASPTATDQSNTQRDVDITAAIRRALMDDASLSTAAKNITVITQSGVVTLKGAVATQAEKDSIEAKARAVANVVRIDNMLTVKSDQADARSDADITAAVQRAFAANGDYSITANSVTVSTDAGVVTLKGTVHTQAEKDALGALAKGVPNVIRVDNQIMVKS